MKPLIRTAKRATIFLLLYLALAPQYAEGQARRSAPGHRVHPAQQQRRAPDRNVTRPSRPPARQAPAQRTNRSQVNRNAHQRNFDRNRTNISGNRRNVNVNIDNSKNIRMHNTRNTVVRRNAIATYPRPPYYWGGRRYYAYHPYAYHPYRPFVWGPVWHPWGFFLTTLAVTAVVVSVNNAHYHYDQGVWYQQENNGYVVVQAPVGGAVTTIPSNAQPVAVNNVTNYYYGGAYYEKSGSEYKVVAPPAGAVVDNLPEGGEEVKIGDQTYVKYGETYYQPVTVDGGNKYEVVQIEDGAE